MNYPVGRLAASKTIDFTGVEDTYEIEEMPIMVGSLMLGYFAVSFAVEGMDDQFIPGKTMTVRSLENDTTTELPVFCFGAGQRNTSTTLETRMAEAISKRIEADWYNINRFLFDRHRD